MLSCYVVLILEDDLRAALKVIKAKRQEEAAVVTEPSPERPVR